MKRYEGRRDPDGCQVLVRDEEGSTRDLPRRFDLRAHSPTGFEWGYPGSGPAQLALALCAEVLGDDDRALDVYQAFKRRVVGVLVGDSWSLTEEQILSVITALERERDGPGPGRPAPGRG